MRTKYRVWIGLGLVVFLTIAASWVVLKNRRSQDSFEEQLRLARKEGLPASMDELVAALPKVKDSENAARLYIRMTQVHSDLDGVQDTMDLLLVDASQNAAVQSRRLLADNRQLMELADQAVRLPYCAILPKESDDAVSEWKQGDCARGAARLYIVKAAFAYRSANYADAAANLNKAWSVSKHLYEGRQWEACRTVQRNCLDALTPWLFEHPSQPSLRNAFKRMVDGYDLVDYRTENRGLLASILRAIQWSESEQGRKKFFLDSDSISQIVADAAEARKESPPSKTRVVEAVRNYWKQLDGKPRMDQRTEEASWLIESELKPFAVPTFEVVSETSWEQKKKDVERRLAAYRAFWRAIASRRIAKHIETRDLVGPWTGKTAEYAYDGRQMVIRVDGESSDHALTFKIGLKVFSGASYVH